MAQLNWPTIAEAADSLGVSGQYINRLVQQGRIHAVKRGGAWFLDPESLRQYEATRKRRRKQPQ